MKRQVSLDIFRGLTLAAMLLVNNPGSWSHVYAPFLHAKWHGLTPTDLIFPFFLFIVGSAMYYSMAAFAVSSSAPQTRNIPWLKIIKRTALLFLIGFLLNIFPFTGAISEWRIMGVLQRIALCYGVAAVLVCVCNLRQLALCCIGLLLGYWALLNIVAVPYGLSSNLVRIVDLQLLGEAHLYQGFGLAFDPEGLLSCVPAVVSVLAGYLTSAFLGQTKTAKSQYRSLLLYGIIALVLAGLWHVLMPINKALWTSSYVLVTSGFAWLVLAVIIYLYEIKQYHRWFKWAQVYGSNPLFIYVIAWVFAICLTLVSWTTEAGNTQNLQGLMYQSLSTFMPEKLASLCFALLFVGLFYGVSNFLYKRKIFIKL
ncbi:heparan-alpha-glucosaminide N-acetyltransferase domain-containing protein [Paraglaciecola sp.]|uniref:acyltransferase family protein n=1 Tax=Paraglaciecola sp. TaxID=1920173 RepID=UPI0030F413EA